MVHLLSLTPKLSSKIVGSGLTSGFKKKSHISCSVNLDQIQPEQYFKGN